MILSGENIILEEKRFLLQTLSTTKPTWTGLGLNLGFWPERLVVTLWLDFLLRKKSGLRYMHRVTLLYAISGFHCNVNEICILFGFYAV